MRENIKQNYETFLSFSDFFISCFIRWHGVWLITNSTLKKIDKCSIIINNRVRENVRSWTAPHASRCTARGTALKLSNYQKLNCLEQKILSVHLLNHMLMATWWISHAWWKKPRCRIESTVQESSIHTGLESKQPKLPWPSPARHIQKVYWPGPL